MPRPATLPGATIRAENALALPGRADALTLAVAVCAVSTSGPLIAACTVSSLAISFWRNACASALMVPAALVRQRHELRRVTPVALLAGVLLALHFATWIPSVSLTSVASATALVATQPVWSALIARARGAHIPRGAWWGIGLAVAGAALVTGVDVTVSGRALEGDLLAVVGGAFAAMYVEAGGRARASLTTTTYTAVCYTVCALLLLIACAAAGVRLSGYSGRDWALLAALTAGPQLLGHSLVNRALRTTAPIVVSLAILLEVPGAGMIAYVWLGQHPSVLAIPGLALLLAGITAVVRVGGRQLPPPDALE